MNPAEAIGIIDAAMGDDWQGLEPSEEDIALAAVTLHQTGLTGTLPGRYGRTVVGILDAIVAGNLPCPEGITLQKVG